VGLSIPAAAITYGDQDEDDGHPYVGLAVFFDGSGPLWSCSGTLLSPTVFLTAGHCTSETTSARVWFESDLSGIDEFPFEGGTLIAEENIHTHPDYDGYATFLNTRDLGILILAESDQPDDDDDYGVLPGLDELDDLIPRHGPKAIIRTVGYGWQMIKPKPQHELVRYTSTSMLVNLRSHLTDGFNIHTSNNPGKGQGTGGACLGDSGGPIFFPQDSNIVVGVVSFGLNSNCKGADFAYRIDTVDALWFINDYIEPE